jgi:hypothetical protein
MSYLDKELARLEKYIEGLGITLIKRSKQDKDSETTNYGTWSHNEIELFVNEHATKTEIILTLLHELGHQVYFKHHDQPPIPDEVMLPLSTLTKSQRKKILDYERNGIEYMPTIAIELGLKIPLFKVYLQSEYDIWQYEYLYEHGKYPGIKERKLKKKELTKKYKGK